MKLLLAFIAISLSIYFDRTWALDKKGFDAKNLWNEMKNSKAVEFPTAENSPCVQKAREVEQQYKQGSDINEIKNKVVNLMFEGCIRSAIRKNRGLMSGQREDKQGEGQGEKKKDEVQGDKNPKEVNQGQSKKDENIPVIYHVLGRVKLFGYPTFHVSVGVDVELPLITPRLLIARQKEIIKEKYDEMKRKRKEKTDHKEGQK